MTLAHNPLESTDASILPQLLDSTLTALSHYSNVHRGSGAFSRFSTHLYEEARKRVLVHLRLDPNRFLVIFCSDYGAAQLKRFFSTPPLHLIRSEDLGLPLGICALVVKKKGLPKNPPPIRGGGNARLLGKDWEIWARPPARFEAGTPALIPLLLLVNGLRMGLSSKPAASSAGQPEETPVTSILYEDAWQDVKGRALLEAMRHNFIGKDTPVPVLGGQKPYVHFDHAASTLAFKPAWDVFTATLERGEMDRKNLVEEVRKITASFLNAPQDQYDIYFTLNATESINILAGLFAHKDFEEGDPVILSTVMEHSSNDLPWRSLPGHTTLRIGMDKDGFLDLDALEQALIEYNQEAKYGRKRIRLVALTAASNLLGTCNDVAKICRLAHQYGAEVMLDAAQWVAHRPIDMLRTGIDFLVFSGHKMYSPFGTGVLLTPKGWIEKGNLSPLASLPLEGNVAGIAALGKAMLLLQRIGYEIIIAEEQTLTRRMMTGLIETPELQLYGISDIDSPRFTDRVGVFAFDLKGRFPGKLAGALAEQAGFGTRYGCHCAHILVKHLTGIPKPLERFQALLVHLFPRLNLPGMLRVSLGLANTKEEVDAFVAVFQRIASKKAKKEIVRGSSEKKDREKRIREYQDSLTAKVFPGL